MCRSLSGASGASGMGQTIKGLVQAQTSLPQASQGLFHLSLGVPQASSCSQAGHSARQRRKMDRQMEDIYSHLATQKTCRNQPAPHLGPSNTYLTFQGVGLHRSLADMMQGSALLQKSLALCFSPSKQYFSREYGEPYSQSPQTCGTSSELHSYYNYNYNYSLEYTLYIQVVLEL